MIDLHCHILPGLDDGAADISVSLKMARAFWADGVTVVACTPHILPGLYSNSGPRILDAITHFQRRLDGEQIPLQLVAGADIHLAPGMIPDLRSGYLPTINGSRYLLIEAPHDALPPDLENTLSDLQSAGYVPILTHPERLSWIAGHYDVIERLAQDGVWMQITAGSLAGAFGSRAKYWAERMLEQALVHVMASDAHDDCWRPPDLLRGWELAARRVGGAEADNLVLSRPRGVLSNAEPSTLPLPAGVRVVSGGTHGDVGQYAHPYASAGKGAARLRHAATAGIGGIPDRLRRLFG
jgi:protein-tyrosine phosphatase